MLNEVNFADVRVAFVEGAITSEGSVARRLTISATSEVVKAASDYKGSNEVDVVWTKGSKKTGIEVVVEATLNVASGEAAKVVGDFGSGVINSSAKKLLKQANKTIKRIRQGSQNNVAAVALRDQLESTIKGNSEIAGKVVSSTTAITT